MAPRGPTAAAIFALSLGGPNVQMILFLHQDSERFPGSKTVILISEFALSKIKSPLQNDWNTRISQPFDIAKTAFALNDH